MSSQQSIDTVVLGLLNGRKPTGVYLSGPESQKLADALSAKIDAGVAPSLCAHAMCCSSAAGNVAVVKMLSKRPMSTFNKAYNFGEPLRRACRAFAKSSDPAQREALAECARLIAFAKGDLDQPDKYLKSGLSAAGSLRACGTEEAMALLEELKTIQHSGKGDEEMKAVKKKEKVTKVEGNRVKSGSLNETPIVSKKRKIVD